MRKWKESSCQQGSVDDGWDYYFGMQLIGFAQKKAVMAPSLKYPYKMVNWLMAPHGHSIFWQTIHKLAYSRAWRLSSRNTMPTEVYCQILCSFMHNVSSSNVHQAIQIVAASGSSLMNQILLHKIKAWGTCWITWLPYDILSEVSLQSELYWAVLGICEACLSWASCHILQIRSWEECPLCPRWAFTVLHQSNSYVV